jgi:hypothetical protein
MAWIDFYQQSWTTDSDYVIDEIYSSSDLIPMDQLQNTQFTVPEDAKLGTTRLRYLMMSTWDGVPHLSPCGRWVFGWNVDYRVTIVPPTIILDNNGEHSDDNQLSQETQSSCTNVGNTNIGGPTIAYLSIFGKDQQSLVSVSGSCSSVGLSELNTELFLDRGKRYTLEWTLATCDDTPTRAWAKVFIDWNGSGWSRCENGDDDLIAAVFADGAKTRMSTSFLVPLHGAPFLHTTMRIVIMDTLSYEDVTPCSTFSRGSAVQLPVTAVSRH